jgi:hypothetical protein
MLPDMRREDAKARASGMPLCRAPMQNAKELLYESM